MHAEEVARNLSLISRPNAIIIMQSAGDCPAPRPAKPPSHRQQRFNKAFPADPRGKDRCRINLTQAAASAYFTRMILDRETGELADNWDAVSVGGSPHPGPFEYPSPGWLPAPRKQMCLNRKIIPMIRYTVVTSLCVLVGLVPVEAFAAGIQLDSREYKLMLDPNKFVSTEVTSNVNSFWEHILKPIIAHRLDLRDSGAPRSKKNFELDKERKILFRDTESCLLDRNGYSLRERVLSNGEQGTLTREVTLKFRSPDLFLAAETILNGSRNGSRTKFEEDIAPIFVRSNETARVVVQPHSMRSLFSVSAKESVGRDVALEALRDVVAIYPTLKVNLRKAGVPDHSMGAKLINGIGIHELVFEGAKVDLGHDTDGEFALTLWYPQSEANRSTPLAAEISFKYDTDNGRVNEAVARRSLLLFEAMQEELRDWSNPEHLTKTSLVLPAPCQ
jgi:hypothetical protein